MEVTLFNPLPTSITLDRMDVRCKNSTVTCIGATQLCIPSKSSLTTSVYLIPRCAGELEFTGLRVLFLFLCYCRSNSVVFGVTCTDSAITTLNQSMVFPVVFLLPRSHGYSSVSPTPPYTLGYTHFSLCRRDIHHEGISALYEAGDWWHLCPYQANQGREARGRLDLLWVSDCWRGCDG